MGTLKDCNVETLKKVGTIIPGDKYYPTSSSETSPKVSLHLVRGSICVASGSVLTSEDNVTKKYNINQKSIRPSLFYRFRPMYSNVGI